MDLDDSTQEVHEDTRKIHQRAKTARRILLSEPGEEYLDIYEVKMGAKKKSARIFLSILLAWSINIG